jgi:hypothetical protein
MKQRGEAILITLIVVFIIGGLGAVGGYFCAPAVQYQPPSVAGQAVPYIPGK